MTAYYEDKRTVNIERLDALIAQIDSGDTTEAIDELRKIVSKATIKARDFVDAPSLAGRHTVIGVHGPQAWVQLIEDWSEVKGSTDVVPVDELTFESRP